MWLTSSSIGRKVVMALTGAFLVLFVTFHALMNGVALFWPSAYNVVCEFLGANWYALVGSAVLAAGFLLHIIYASWLTIQNRKARGVERYDVTSRPPQVEWSSKNMYILGLVILAFLVVHLIQFWCKMQFAEIFHVNVVDSVSGESVPAAAGTWFLELAFRQPLTLPIYLVGFVALWFHMTHGFWSMFQSAGWNNKVWMNRLKCFGNWWTTIFIALFVAEAIVFTVQAHRNTYTTCPVLLNQYEAMAKEGKAVFIDPCTAGCNQPCDKVCDKPCNKPCDKVCDKACDKPCDKACGKECNGACQGNCEKACGNACPEENNTND